MAVRMRPQNVKDVRELSQASITAQASFDLMKAVDRSVMDDKIFGTTMEHRLCKDKEHEDIFTRTGTIKLAIPVLNPFLAGRNGETWSTLLKNPFIPDLMKGRAAYDKDKGVIVRRENINEPYSAKWAIGGDALLELLKSFDEEEAIKNMLYYSLANKEVHKFIKDAEEDKNKMIGSVLKNTSYDPNELSPDRVWLCDDYYYIPEEPSLELTKIISDNAEKVRMDLFKRRSPRLSFLLSFNKNPERVVNQVLKHIFVLPIGFRPNIEDRSDPISIQYNYLVRQNTELLNLTTYQGSQMKNVLLKYEQLVERVIHIFVGSDKFEYNTPKNYKNLAKTLGHKEGVIRDKMQGVRVDYSARTVITCDPNMPLDTVGVPKAILAKLLELDVIKKVRETSDRNLSSYAMGRNIKFFKREASKLAEDDYILLGRQPTLFYLGIQGFKVIPVEGNALVLSPLVVMPYNADFDGDQMYAIWPVGDKAKQEVAQLMASTKNLFYPRNGELTVIPRHEILYGLWICSKIKQDPRAKSWSESELIELGKKYSSNNILSIILEGVCRQDIEIYDICLITDRKDTRLNGKSAGVIALKSVLWAAGSEYALGVEPLKKYSEGAEDTEVSTKWFKSLFKNVNKDNRSAFVDLVNKMVRLGFAVSEIWPPSISTLNDIDTSDLIKRFNTKIAKRAELVDRGLEIESAFTSYFNDEYSSLQKEIALRVTQELGPENGYIRMWKSGAKGNESNIVQLFGTKGRIMKNEVVAFNTIIENSLSNQLTGLEHFISAYGSRQGIADKSVATATPGYLTRKLGHASANYFISSIDCGTEEGIVWTYDEILPFIDETSLVGDPTFDITHVETFLVNILIGRVALPANEFIKDIADAKRIFRWFVADVTNGEFILKDGVKIRSPITCDNPVCQKCYGKDLTTTSTYPKIGKPIGFVAAQSIGEPGTQLTMKNFQRGGVVSDANLTSSFKKIDTYFHLISLRGKMDDPLTYDAISPREGYVKEIHLGNGTKRIIVTKSKESDKNILGVKKYYVYDKTVLKDYVKVGDSFQAVQGDLDIREVLKYRGFDEAVKYLALMLYNIFNNETELNMKHFEVIIASLISTVVMKGSSDGEVKTGDSLSLIEEKRLKNSDYIGEKTLMGLKELPQYRKDFFESIMMEDMTTFIRRASILNPEDSMKNPKTRTAFGLDLGVGSSYDGYLD